MIKTKVVKCTSAAALIALFSISSSAFAIDLATLAGDWRFEVLSTPSMMQETYYNFETQQTRQGDSSGFAGNNEQLVDVFFPGEFRTEAGSFTMSPEGLISGGVAGSVRVTGSHTVAAMLDETQINFLVNGAGDVLTRGRLDGGDSLEFAVAVRKPTDAVTADLAGIWHFVDMGMPNDLTENYYNSVTMQSRQSTSSSDYARENEQMVDVFFQGGFETGMGTVSVSPSGVLSGDGSGSVSTTADGTVTLDFGDGPEVFRLNASKNLMVRVLSESDEQRLTVIVKEPSSTTLADLAGPWRLTNLIMPNRLREAFWNSETEQMRDGNDASDFAGPGEQLVDMYFPGASEVESLVVGIAADGSVAGAVSGSLSIAGPGTVTANIEGDVITLHVSSDHDTMWAALSDGDEQSFVALVRVPLEPMKIAFDVEGGNFSLLWLGGSDLKVQQSNNLGSWSDVGGTTGQSALQSSQTNAAFFRVFQLEE